MCSPHVDPGVSRVVSFGSVNLDRVAYVDRSTVEELDAAHEWFPGQGETVRVPDGVPGSFDRYVSETFLGGKGANQAVAAAAAGADAEFLGAVGNDHEEFGVLEGLADRGVDVDAVDIVDGPTGTAYVFVTPDGENYIAYDPGANAAIPPEHADRHRDRILTADCLLVQNEVPAAATGHLLAAIEGVADRPTVVLDPAPPAGATTLLEHAAVDLATPNEHEARSLGDALGSVPTVVETRGGDPGDVFAGYLAAGLAVGDDPRRAIRVATTAASLSTEREGVQRAVPERATVADRLDDRDHDGTARP